MNLPTTVIKYFIELNNYDVNIISKLMILNKYYLEQCKKNFIWKSVYVKYFSQTAFDLENNSRSNRKIIQRARKEFLKLPPREIGVDSKNWYQTVESLFNFNQLNWILVDCGSFAIKFLDNNGSRKIMMNTEHPRHLMITDKLIKEITTAKNHESPDNAPLVVSVNPCYYPDKKAELKDIRTKLGRIIHFKNAGLLALESFGLLSGIVVICGMKYTQLVAFDKGRQLDYKFLPYTGNILHSVVTENKNDFWKDFVLTPLRWYRSLEVIEDFKLRKLHDPNLNDSYIYSPEFYFEPENCRKEFQKHQYTKIGIIENTIDFIYSIKGRFLPKSQSETSSIFDNIILTGGISNISGFQNKFKLDLLQKLPSANLIYSDNPVYDILKGLYVDNALTESYHDIYQVDKK